MEFNSHEDYNLIFAIFSRKQKCIYSNCGRSSDLLPYLNAFPDPLLISPKERNKTPRMRKFEWFASGKSVIKYSFPISNPVGEVWMELTAAGTVSDLHRIPFYSYFQIKNMNTIIECKGSIFLQKSNWAH